jgi:hypothetical protein
MFTPRLAPTVLQRLAPHLAAASALGAAGPLSAGLGLQCGEAPQQTRVTADAGDNIWSLEYSNTMADAIVGQCQVTGTMGAVMSTGTVGQWRW